MDHMLDCDFSVDYSIINGTIQLVCVRFAITVILDDTLVLFLLPNSCLNGRYRSSVLLLHAFTTLVIISSNGENFSVVLW